MRFAVIGGDRRSAALAELLLRDGHRVRSFALEKAALPAEIPRDGCLHSCVYGADCVLLPCPAEKGGFLNAPLSAEELPAAELVEAMWPGQLLLGGRFSEETVTAALRGKLQVADLLRRQELAVGNAALTAEGAVEKLIANSDRSLWGGRVLVLGWGRIGSLLALRLHALGAARTPCCWSWPRPPAASTGPWPPTSASGPWPPRDCPERRRPCRRRCCCRRRCTPPSRKWRIEHGKETPGPGPVRLLLHL